MRRSAGRTVRCAWQRSGFWVEGFDQHPAGRFTAVDVLGRRAAAVLAEDRHHPAAQPGRPDVPPGPGAGGAVGGGGTGVAGEIHGSGDGVIGGCVGSGGSDVGPLLQQARVKGGPCPPQWMRQLRRERSWAPSMWRPALSASLMAALSGLVVVVTASHSESRASSSSITTAEDLRLLSS